jgi:hypothetical protein
MRKASNARKIAASAMRNMQVPAYCPVDVGVQAVEKSGVLVEVKKVMLIMSMLIIVIPESAVGIDMPPIALVGEGDSDMGIVIDASIFIMAALDV